MKKRVLSCLLAFVMVAGCFGEMPLQSQAAVTPKKAVVKVKKALGDDYRCDLAYTKEQINRTFGLASSDYSKVYGEGMNIIVHVDNILVVKPKKGKATKVKRALKAYKQNELVMPYPMNVEQLNNTRIETINGYVCYICFSTKALNNKAIKILRKALK
jgi:hypothetical protein